MKRTIIVLSIFIGLFVIYKLWYLKIIKYGLLLIGVSLIGVFIQDCFTRERYSRSRIGRRSQNE